MVIELVLYIVPYFLSYLQSGKIVK